MPTPVHNALVATVLHFICLGGPGVGGGGEVKAGGEQAAHTHGWAAFCVEVALSPFSVVL